jgi:polyisoprenoid-binding protein YceI
MEDIKADNNQVISIINAATGEIQFSVLNNAFHFKKALMEEHFNNDYIESAKYPKSTFKGTITNLKAVNFDADGAYNVTVSGTITIHGVSKPISTTGKLTIKSGKVSAFAKFTVKPKDYNISIPSTFKNNIADSIELTINCGYEKK